MSSTLHVTIAQRASQSSISGVFDTKLALQAYLLQIPARTRADHRIEILHGFHYPLHVVEESGRFLFPTHAQALALVRALFGMQPRNAADEPNMIIYRISENYRPKAPGQDEMGELLHHHVTGESMAVIEQVGLDGIWGLAPAIRL